MRIFMMIALWFENELKCHWMFGHISNWNTTRITSMEMAFYTKKTFQEDISRWDVSNVTKMGE
jgi:surface protein